MDTSSIQKQLRSLLKETEDNNLFDELDDILSDIKKWDGTGEVPFKKRLKELGISFESSESSEQVSSEPPPSKPDEAAPIGDSASESVRLQTELNDEPIDLVAEESNQIWQKIYAEGVEARNKSNFKQAIEKFQQIVNEASEGALKDKAKNNLGDAQTRLNQKIEKLVVQANAIPVIPSQLTASFQVDSSTRPEELPKLLAKPLRELKTHLEKTQREWQEILLLQPNHADAKQMLDQIANCMAMRTLQEKVIDAFQRKNWPDFNKSLEAVPELVEKAHEGKPGVKIWFDAVQESQRVLKGKLQNILGIVSTLEVEGDFRKAYREVKEAFKHNMPELIDEGNVLGKGANRSVKTDEMLDHVLSKYLPALREKIVDKLRLAEQSGHLNPQENIKILQGFLEQVEELSLDERVKLSEDIEPPFEERLKNGIADLKKIATVIDQIEPLIQEIKDPYGHSTFRKKSMNSQKAVKIIASLGGDPRWEPTITGLLTRISEAKNSNPGVYQIEIENAIASAKRLVIQNNFKEAIAKINSAKEKWDKFATKEKPSIPKKDWTEGIRQCLRDAEAENNRIAELQIAYSEFLKKIRVLNQELDNVKKGGKKIGSLRYQLDELKKTYPHWSQRTTEVSQLSAEIADQQGNFENWQEGKIAYQEARWKDAQLFLKKITPDFTYYQQAQNLLDRVAGVLSYLAAKEAISREELEESLSEFKKASNFFKKADVDEITQEMGKESLIKIQELEIKNKETAKIDEIINSGKSHVKEAKEVYVQRLKGSLNDQVRSYPAINTFISEIDQALQEHPFRTQDLESILQELRGIWRQLYQLGIKNAQGCQDIFILKMAVQRAEELRAQGLWNLQDRELSKQIECELLDLEYQKLIQAIVKNWEEIALNREKRVEKKFDKEVEKQWLEARWQSVQQEVIRKENNNLQEAHQYLYTEIGKRDECSIAEIQKLITLAWQIEDWKSAEKDTRLFPVKVKKYPQSTQLENIWKLLTKAAKSFSELDISGGQAWVDQVRKDFPGFKSVINHQVDFLKEKALNKLLMKTEKVANTDDEKLQAIQWLAQALQLSPKHQVVIHRLKTIGQQLENDIPSHLQDSQLLPSRNNKLKNKYQKGKKLVEQFKALLEVSDFLNWDGELITQITYEVEELSPKIKIWEEVVKHLEEAERNIEKALHNPKINSKNYWDFSSAEYAIDKAYEKAANEPGGRLQNEIDPLDGKLKKYKKSGEELSACINNLMEAIRQENFAVVETKADEFEQLQSKHRAEGWRGFNQLLRYIYPEDLGSVDNAEKHKSIAIKQRQNYEAWRAWGNKIKAYTDEIKSEENKLINKPLGDLIYDMRLEDIIEDAKKTKKSIGIILNEMNDHPSTVLSHKARQEMKKVNIDTLKPEMQELFPKLDALEKKSEEKLKEFSSHLDKLNQYMKSIKSVRAPGYNKRLFRKNRKHKKKEIPKPMLNTAKEFLKECQQFNPLNKQVVEHKNYLDEIGE